MRIVHLTQSIAFGGAAIAAHRIHQAVTECGVESKMLTELALSSDHAFNPLTRRDRFHRRAAKFISKRVSRIFIGNMSVYFSTGLIPSPWLKYLQMAKPDIVHLHFLGNEILSITQISKISSPVVITVHDYWVLGSGFHLAYLDRCAITQKNKILFNLMRYIEKTKVNKWKNKNITFIAPSTFVENLLKAHPFLSEFNIQKIHHPLSKDLFHIQSKSQSRAILGLGSQKKYILFPARYGYEDPNKGFHILKDILKNIRLKYDHDFELLLFGKDPGNSLEELACDVHFLGHTSNNDYLNHIYSASDVLVLPSRFETYGLVVQEALKCGLPSVVTAGLGMDDIIDHGKNGFLVNYGDVEKFGNAVVAAFQLKMDAQDDKLAKFNSDIVGENYKMVYQNILDNTC